MKPIYSISVNGANLDVKDKLISLNITDELGLLSDRAEILLDDSDDKLTIPPRGVEIAISLGYEGEGLYPMGTYIADEIEISGMPRQMRITARASDSKIRDLFSSITATKSRSWHKKLLGEIVDKIAGEHGFAESMIDKNLQGIYMPHLDQTDESDISFLQRLARDLSGFIKPSGGKLLFMKHGLSSLPTIHLEGKHISNFNMTVEERAKYSKVTAKWHNFKTGKEEKVSAGQGDPSYSIRHIYASESIAKSAVEAKYREIQNGRTKLELVMIGNPKLCSEGSIVVNNLSHKVNGKWHVVSVNHQFENTGYITRLMCNKWQ